MDEPRLLSDFQIRTDKLVIYNQLDVVVVNKLHRKAVIKDLAIPGESNSKKKRKQAEEVEKMWKGSKWCNWTAVVGYDPKTGSFALTYFRNIISMSVQRNRRNS